MPTFHFRPARLARTLLASAGLFTAAGLHAGITISYQPGDDDPTDYDTSGAADPTTLLINGGSATQSGVLSGTGSVIKAGAGSLTLSETNTYAGGTTLDAGTLRLTMAGTFGNGDGLLTINGGALGNSAGEEGSFISNDVAITQDFAIDAQGAGGSVEFFGAVNLGAAATRTITLTSTGLACFGGAITGQNLDFVTTAGSSQVMFCDVDSNAFTGTLRVGSGVALELLKVADGIAVSGNLLVDSGGSVLVSNEAQFAATSNIAVNGTLTLSSTQTNSINALSGSGTVNADQADTLEVNSGTFDGVLANGTDNLQLTKKGAGTLTLTGANTATGATTIDGGTLLVDGSLATGSAVSINAGGTLGGQGTVGAVTIHSGGIISPGHSPGILSTGAETWEGGGAYAWEINDATGAKGSASDWLSLTGSLTLNATSVSPFTIQITSLTPANTPGLAANFDPNSDYSWILATAGTPISGFDPSHFDIGSSGFANLPGSDHFSLSVNNRDLVLTYSAVPEPRGLALLGAALLALVVMRRRGVA